MLLLTGFLHLVIILGWGCEKLGRKHPNHEIVLTIYDADGSEELAPTPISPTMNTTTYYGLQRYLQDLPDYEKKLPHGARGDAAAPLETASQSPTDAWVPQDRPKQHILVIHGYIISFVS